MDKYLLTPVRADAPAAEHRANPRTPVYTEAAFVSVPNFDAPLICAVRDISKEGARLEIERDRRSAPDIVLPEHVTVYFGPREQEAHCRVMWQDGAHFGVEFLEPLHRLGEAVTTG